MVSSEQARDLLQLHGECRPQGSTDWAGEIPLPAAIERFFREVGPVDITIVGCGNPVYFPSLVNLWRHQEGYRWHGVSGARIEDWNSDWVVVADEGADPFIFHVASERILSDWHGQGSWNPEEAFPDLNTRSACIATLGAVVKEAGDRFSDEASDIRPQFRQEARARLARLLGEERLAEQVLGNAGWG